MHKLKSEQSIDSVDVPVCRDVAKVGLFKASAILYIAGATWLFGGVSLPLVEILSRPRTDMPATFIELLEWNPFSEMGLIGLMVGIFLFWLGIMVDRRGA